MIHHNEPFIDPRRWKWTSRGTLFSFAGAIVVLLVMASFADVTLSSRPELCMSCHQIRPLYEEWTTSTHKGVSCVACHTEPGLAGYVKIHVKTVKNVATQALGRDELIQADVSDSSCLRCHPKEERPEVINQATLRVAHSKHDKQQCADCHKTLVHTRQLETPALVKAPVEHVDSKCQVCHKTSVEFAHGPSDVACTSCHSATVPNHDLAQKKGVFPMSGCNDCHKKERVSSPEECQTCHVSPHGIQEACGKCHSSATTWTEKAFTHPVKLVGNHTNLKCEQCHTNGKDFKGLTYTCSNCHQPKHEQRANNVCSVCHTPLGWKVF